MTATSFTSAHASGTPPTPPPPPPPSPPPTTPHPAAPSGPARVEATPTPTSSSPAPAPSPSPSRAPALPAEPSPLPPPAPAASPPVPSTDKKSYFDGANLVDVHPELVEEEPLAASSDVSGKQGPGHMAARTILEVFDGCLKELRATLAQQGLLGSPDGALASGSHESVLLKRWREKRVAEMDVLARRLKLVLENAIKN